MPDPYAYTKVYAQTRELPHNAPGTATFLIRPLVGDDVVLNGVDYKVHAVVQHLDDEVLYVTLMRQS